MHELTLQTTQRTQFIDITREIQSIVTKQGVSTGLCCVFVPHTTAGVTINERCDPDVVEDMVQRLNELVPQSPEFRHSEGNSDAHIKASLVGASATIIISQGQLRLGTWQGIFFCEFDGPRRRRVWAQILKEEGAQ